MSVLDASAVLAFLQGEPGSDRVEAVLERASIGAVNFSEVLSKLSDKGIDGPARRAIAQNLPLNVVPFDWVQAENTADLRSVSRKFGLSFADRACLALGRSLGLPVLTADRIWKDLKLDIEVELIR
jgi:PIN domain nuclease of toxin-antitoxin system